MYNDIKKKADSIADAYIEKMILPSDPLYPLWNRENVVFAKSPKWNYIDNCMIKALVMLYEINGDKRLLDYAAGFMDSYVDDEGNIPTMNISDFNLDNVNGGKNLIYLYKKTGSEKYRLAFEKIYDEQLMNQPRLNCGNFYHKAIYPFQVWLDGVYMAFPFMAEYVSLSGNINIYDDIFRQLENIRNIMFDNKTGLYFHGYDETRSMLWADSSTGLSHEFWLRSMGWLCAGLADLCETIPENMKLYSLCSEMLHDLLESMSKFINPDGTLCQLPAKSYLRRNYPETSGTLLFAYSAMKSARLSVSYDNIKQSGINAFSAVTENYIDFDKNSIPVLKNICLVAGLGGSENRDGSEKYYLSEKITQNDAKGIAPYLMAYCEFIS